MFTKCTQYTKCCRSMSSFIFLYSCLSNFQIVFFLYRELQRCPCRDRKLCQTWSDHTDLKLIGCWKVDLWAHGLNGCARRWDGAMQNTSSLTKMKMGFLFTSVTHCYSYIPHTLIWYFKRCSSKNSYVYQSISACMAWSLILWCTLNQNRLDRDLLTFRVTKYLKWRICHWYFGYFMSCNYEPIDPKAFFKILQSKTWDEWSFTLCTVFWSLQNQIIVN